MRRKILKRQHIMRRKTQHLVGIQRAGQLARRQHRRMQRLGRLVVRDQDQHRRMRPMRRLRSAHKVRKVEGPRGRGQSGHTSPTRAARQMATCTLKGVGVLQVRHQLADEGKNHAVFYFTSCRALSSARVSASSSSVLLSTACPYSSSVTMPTPPQMFPATAGPNQRRIRRPCQLVRQHRRQDLAGGRNAVRKVSQPHHKRQRPDHHHRPGN